MPDIEAVRARAVHYLSADIAAYAAMTLAELQQLVAGTYTPTDAQLVQLGRRMGLDVYE